MVPRHPLPAVCLLLGTFLVTQVELEEGVDRQEGHPVDQGLAMIQVVSFGHMVPSVQKGAVRYGLPPLITCS